MSSPRSNPPGGPHIGDEMAAGPLCTSMAAASFLTLCLPGLSSPEGPCRGSSLCLEYTSPQISIELTPSSLKSLIKRHLLNEAFSTCRRISQCPARKTETTPDILTGGNLIQGAVYTGEGIAEEPNKAALETTQITEPAGAADTPGAKHRGE